MRNVLVLSTAGSVLALSLGGFGAAATEPASLQRLVQKVQSGGEKAPGARGQEGTGKGTAPGSREGGGAGAAQDKGGAPEKSAKGAGPEKGAAADKGARGQKADRGTQMRSGQKATRERQRTTERGGRTGVDVDIRGDRGYRSRADVNVDRGRRSSGRDVNVRGGYGYGGVSCQDILRRYRQCVGR
jgi:hypothetical protein